MTPESAGKTIFRAATKIQKINLISMRSFKIFCFKFDDMEMAYLLWLVVERLGKNLNR